MVNFPNDLNGQTVPNNTYPQLNYVTGITNAIQAVVSLQNTNEYTVGENISFRIAPQFGMVELNNQVATVIAASTNSVTINVDTTNFVHFNGSGVNHQYPCMVVPSSSGIIPASFPRQTNLADSFDNIPPN